MCRTRPPALYLSSSGARLAEVAQSTAVNMLGGNPSEFAKKVTCSVRRRPARAHPRDAKHLAERKRTGRRSSVAHGSTYSENAWGQIPCEYTGHCVFMFLSC